MESKISKALQRREPEILAKWLELQEKSGRRMSATEQQQLSRSSRDFLGAIRVAATSGQTDLSSKEWDATKEFLKDFSSARAKEGYTPSETASFVFSLKQPVFEALGEELSKDLKALLDANWEASTLLDNLGLFTIESFQKTREDIISRQQQELLELSTPVVRLWENVLALPLIGTLDSARTQIVMQNLLDAIVETRSDFAIIDITGVPVVDTLVAQHLLKTVAAARLMGADCVISGIRPQIAQTIIHLGVDLSDVTTKATLADAFALVLRRSGQKIVQDDRPKPAQR
ncbi:MAG: STAS domain-containing protein [Bryobacteraceae bacterium]